MSEHTEDWKVNEVAQLRPDNCRNPMFRGCMMVVTEVKSWGCQGYVQALGSDNEMGGQAYYRAKWEEMDKTGGVTMWAEPEAAE